MYWDSKHLLHANAGKPSENGPLFTAEYYLFKSLGAGLSPDDYLFGKHALNSILRTENGHSWFDPNPVDANEPSVRFSHDNMLGMYVLTHLFGSISDLDKLPLIKLNNRYWYHPVNLGVNLLIKGEVLWGLLFCPLVLFASLLSLSKPRYVTSGKCMWLVRALMFTLSESSVIRSLGYLLLNLSDIMLKKEHGEDRPWEDVFAIYFLEEEHPIHARLANLYKEGIL
jgi:hypothetical protein